jgi:hypothetical protein
MTFQIDKKLHWTDHYVEYGFAVVKGAVGPEFTQPALQAVRKLLGNNLPLKDWNKANTATRHNDSSKDPVLLQVYDQPGIQEIIRTMFTPGDTWSGERHFQLFVNPFDPEAAQTLSPEGHLDFVRSPIPIFGSGFMFQVSLVKSEPFSGNLTLYPGSHKLVQRELVANPDLHYPTSPEIVRHLACDPYEFVAEPGDVCLFHHLVAHNGNVSHATGKSPRVALHCQGLCPNWLQQIDPAAKGMSPWRRSLAFTGGPYRVVEDEYEKIMRFNREKKQKQYQPT